jgi:hypothetical protein
MAWIVWRLGGRMKDWRQRAKDRLEPVLFLRFAILPLIIMGLVTAYMWDQHVENIGCVSVAKLRQGLLYEANPLPLPRCEGTVHKQVSGRGGAGQQGAPAPAGPQRPVAIASGRFQWMTFHLVALVLFPTAGFIALALLYRNLRPVRFLVATLAALGIGGWWAMRYLTRELEPGIAILLEPTKTLALSRFDRSFADRAWSGMWWDFCIILMLIMLIIVAASAVLDGVNTRRLSTPRIQQKRQDLKLILILASLVMTFNTLYWAEWVAWPARFAPADPTGMVRGSAEEIRAFANDLRLYWGTGYTLVLIGFAVPAILALSRRTRKEAAAGDDGGPPYQRVFTAAELRLLSSVFVPFVTALAGSAFQL